ncbi:MAG: NgoFVII family restriction endonuclease [Bacteroidetes bacterium]|nr:MAG: NgoFVII family restriction endonuclease [Bacteroidota bacterium]
MPKIYDNIEHHLTKGLNETLEVSHRTDFCVGYFNLRGWKEVAEKIDSLQGVTLAEGEEEVHRICRLLVGMQKLPVDILREYFYRDEDHIFDQAEASKLKKRLAQEFKDQLTIGAPTEHDEIALRKLSRQMKEKKVVVKLHLRYPLHAKLYLAFSNDKRVPVVGFLGSSNLTLAGLSKQGELNIDVLEQDAANKLALWFNDRWLDRWCIDITQELIEIIDNSWAADRLLSPYHIYLKIVYHLSQEARAGLNDYSLPKVFQRDLLVFQQMAVKIAAKKLDNRDGVLIGDVVGLGKTITACALAKMFEEMNFFSTLIICPPNLKPMWKEYIVKYDLKAETCSIGEVQKKLPELKRFRIVIIDESHNLRNDEGSRYRAIKSYLDENESKVILLSATPYNKSYVDLSNQLRLFISDEKDLGISPERYISEIGGQVQFMAKHTETFIRSIKAFERSEYADDWRELMRLYMVRRTRSFIKANYGVTDATTGKVGLKFPDGHFEPFPERVPKKVEYEFDPNDPKDQYAKLYTKTVVETIEHMTLPRYGLKKYLETNPTIRATKDEEVIMQNLSRAGKRLMGFCRTNLFKRLESSGYSFLLSLSRHILRNYVFVYAIQNKLPLPIGKNISQNLDDYLEDTDTDQNGNQENYLKLILKPEMYLTQAEKLYKDFESPAYRNRFDWIRSQFFSSSLQQTLIGDGEDIIKILNIGKDWNAEQDRQLNALHRLLTVTHKDEKVIVFTQFADTAWYLTEQLKKRGMKSIECVTGDHENPSALAHRFSPISNQHPEIVQMKQDLRVLISTDVLSEGQNLQDAHIILNYDLPWAIIRLIQRAGRIDRIGQKAEKILCYSFFPEDGIEEIIKLRKRLTNRIRQNAEVVGSDETFFDGDPINIMDLYNEKGGILDEDERDTEVDLTSYAYQIWKNALDINPSLNKTIPDLPNVCYATKHNTSEPEHEGVILYSRTSDENDMLVWLDDKGKTITQSQRAILDAAQCSTDTEAKYKLPNHHELVKKGIDFIREEEKNTGGSLGKKTGVKFRTYTRLKNFCEDNEGTLFVNEQLKKAVDDIFKYPMKDFARDTINRQMKAGISDEELSSLVISLREEDKLCIVDPDEHPFKEPQIICSLGLTNS